MIRCIDVKLTIPLLSMVPCFPLFASCQPSDVLDLKTALGMKPRKVTLTGPVLTMCKLTKGGRGTRACEVCVLRHSRSYSICCTLREAAQCKRDRGRFDGGAPFGTSGCVVVPCSVFLHRFVLPVYFGKLLCDAVKDLPYMKLR